MVYKINGVEVKVGQTWRQRNGDTEIIASFDDHPTYPIDGKSGTAYTADGHDWDGEESDSDLIELISEAPVVSPAEKAAITEAQLALDITATGQENIRELTSRLTAAEMSVPGYEQLADVLRRAYNQAARGKGKERHARDAEPFHEQVILQGAKRFGTGALLFQAFKKSEESQRLPKDRAVAELFGAIVYLSAAVIALESEQS